MLDDLLDSHNIAHTGVGDSRLLSIIAQSAEGEFQGGLHGYTWGGYCEIKVLFVAERHRRQGLGRLMMDAVEAEALRRDCGRVILSTHSFQAPVFYEKLGYSIVAQLDDCPVNHRYILLTKRLMKFPESSS